MANLYISEYAQPSASSAQDQITVEPSTDQVVVFTTTTQSTTLLPNTQLVRVHSDGICSIKVGVNPTATTSNKRLVAGQDLFFQIPLSSGFKIAAVTNT